MGVAGRRRLVAQPGGLTFGFAPHLVNVTFIVIARYNEEVTAWCNVAELASRATMRYRITCRTVPQYNRMTPTPLDPTTQTWRMRNRPGPWHPTGQQLLLTTKVRTKLLCLCHLRQLRRLTFTDESQNRSVKEFRKSLSIWRSYR